MATPVVWEGSAFAQVLAEALAEDAAGESLGGALLETAQLPDAAAAALLAGAPPEPERETEGEGEADEAAASAWAWAGLWSEGPGRRRARAALVRTYARRCDRAVRASRFGGRGRAQPEDGSAAGADAAAPATAARQWLEYGALAAGAGCVLTAATAAGAALQLRESGRSRLAAAVGVLALPSLALAAGRLHSATADARLTVLLERNWDLLGRSIEGVTLLQQTCQHSVRTIQEVELLARGYNVVPSASFALPPISRLERRDRDRRCQALRTAVATSLLRARAATAEAHRRVETELGKWYTDAASKCAFSSRAAVAKKQRDDPAMGDIKALKSSGRSLHDEYTALVTTSTYRIGKLARRAGSSIEAGGRGDNWSDTVEMFVTALSYVLEPLGQEIDALNTELRDATAYSMDVARDRESQTGRGESGAAGGSGNAAAAVGLFQAGVVDIYHAAHKLSSRALLFHGRACGGSTDTSGPIDLVLMGGLKQASLVLTTLRDDLRSCACLIDASDDALAKLIARQDPNAVADPPKAGVPDGRSKLGQRDHVYIESADPVLADQTKTEVFECEVQVLSSDSGATELVVLTAEQQREVRKARMAARQIERQEKLKLADEAEKARATARRFYHELQAVVGSQTSDAT